MSLTTFSTASGHCVQITTAGVVDGILRISGYGETVEDAKQDAIRKLLVYTTEKKRHERQSVVHDPMTNILS
jgi:hypothetical protein